MENKQKSKMIYRYLGNSGLRVSVLGWGNWINHSDDYQVTYDTLKFAIENGINFIDTAEIYGFGQAETCIGKALEKLNFPRESLVISTKIYSAGSDVNQTFLSRKHILEGVNNSLKRLKLDYLDVVFCHRYDSFTPMEEICRAMNQVIQDKKAFYWGTSEWNAAQIMEAYLCCEQHGLIKPIVEQPQYNMFCREKFEKEYEILFNKFKMGSTIWSPLMGGILTGKYINETPKGSRLDVLNPYLMSFYSNYTKNKKFYDDKLNQLKNISDRLGCSLSCLALAWAIKNPDVSTCILGVTKVSQMEENLKALDVLPLLNNKIEKEIEKVIDNTPVTDFEWRDFKKFKGRREVAIPKF